MLEYRRRVIRRALKGLFLTQRDEDAAMEWWVANDGRRPVLFVGAGYSRNAFRKGTRERATGVATWDEVGTRLCKDLGIEPGAFDVPTTADLFADRFGEGHLRDVLLALVEDDKLEPGPAHEALLGYDAEAIITTNHLDTLLDHGGSNWDQVVRDSDVSKMDPARPRARQVIYYHGHRHHSDSWVVRRTDYEDNESKRPIIGARVRQLFAQYPLLAVGYSLTDPDFHAIYRKMSLDMNRGQPRGLALLVNEPTAASVTYWHKLGVSVATLAPKDYSSTFVSFFASARPRVTTSQLLEVFQPSESLSDRVKALREYIDDEDRARFVDSSTDRDEKLLWDSVECRIPAADRDAVRSRGRRRAAAARKTVESEPSPRVGDDDAGFKNFPSERFAHSSHAVAVLNRVVEMEGGWRGVADWARLAFERPRIRDAAERRFPELPALVSWIWGQAAKGDAGARDEAIRISKECLSYADRYELTLLQRWIREDLLALNVTEMVASPAVPSQTAQRDMLEAARLALEGEWEDCGEAYKRAGGEATRGGDHFGAWLAAEGRAWSERRRTARLTADDVGRRVDELNREAQLLSEHDDVTWWIEKAKRRLDELRKRTVDELRQQLREGDRDVERMSWSNVPHYAWRSWRDLHLRAAPHHLQREYLEPLLAAGALNNVDEELRARLEFEVEGTEKWIDDVCSDPSRAAGDSVEKKLMDAFRSIAKGGSRAERSQVVELVPVMVKICRDEDLKWMSEFLQETQVGFSKPVGTPRMNKTSTRDHARAWLALADTQKGDAACVTMLAARNAMTGSQRNELSRSLGDVNWQSWVSTGFVLEEALTMCLSLGEDYGQDSAAVLGVISGIADILRAGRYCAKAASPVTLLAAEKWLRQAIDLKVEDWIRPNILHAAVDLALEIRRSPVEENEFVNAIIAKMDEPSQDEGASPGGLTYALEGRCRVLALLLAEGAAPTTIGAAERLVRDLMTHWTVVRRFLSLNVRHAPATAYFIVEALALADASPEPGWLRATILELAELTPSILPVLAPILSAKFWPDRADELARLLRMGGWHEGRASRLMFRADLLTRLVSDRLRREPGQPDVRPYLAELATLATEERDETVANHAAYALVAWLEVAEDERLAAAAVDTLEHLADDPRIAVRHAAAYGAARLSSTAQLAGVRSRMHAIGTKLADDPSAQVQRQTEVGRAEAERRSGPRVRQERL